MHASRSAWGHASKEPLPDSESRSMSVIGQVSQLGTEDSFDTRLTTARTLSLGMGSMSDSSPACHEIDDPIQISVPTCRTHLPLCFLSSKHMIICLVIVVRDARAGR